MRDVRGAALRALIVSGLLVIGVACTKPVSDDTSSASASQSASNFSVAGGSTSAAAAPKAATAKLDAVASSGATGTVALAEAGGKTTLDITMTGLKPGPHAVYLQGGSCEGGGERTGPLGPITAAADGASKGTAELVNKPIGGLAGSVYVQIFEGAGDTLGKVVACGKIEAAS